MVDWNILLSPLIVVHSLNIILGISIQLENLFPLQLLELRHQERECRKFWLPSLLDLGAHLFEDTGLMECVTVHLHGESGHVMLLFFIELWEEVRLRVSVELPDKNAIVFTSTEDHVVVKRVEHSAEDRVGVADEGLEVSWCCCLGFEIPDLEKIVIAASQHEATIV